MLNIPEQNGALPIPSNATSTVSYERIHITGAEWRWVIGLALFFCLVIFTPLLWVALRGNGDWQFMGVLHNYLDGATYLSKMELGYRGSWLVSFQHTSEDHAGAFIQILYLILGHIVRITSLPPLVVLHVARLGAVLFMFVAFYQFAAVIWSRLRARRIFFIILSIGGGFGWLFAPLTQNVTYPDLFIPEAFPFFSALVNVHFPLTFACLSLLVAILIIAFRPGSANFPFINHYLPLVVLLSLLLSLLYPQALVPISVAVGLSVVYMFVRRSPDAFNSVRWLAAVVLPAVPFAFYYIVTVRYNAAMAQWNLQNITLAPAIPIMLMGFGLPLLIALPAIARSVRRFEQDGDWLMLLWLLSILIIVYLPTSTQRRFAAGMMIPIAYFATRAAEDFWLPFINRRWRTLTYSLAVMMMMISPIMILFLPILPALTGYQGAAIGIFLEHDYDNAFTWLRANTEPSDVILASAPVSVWIPGWVGARIVYGHDYETLNAVKKKAQVQAWYAEGVDCEVLLAQYGVKYILVGPQEARLGTAPCLEGLERVAEMNTVSIYAP